jgi:hypothetical protein
VLGAVLLMIIWTVLYGSFDGGLVMAAGLIAFLMLVRDRDRHERNARQIADFVRAAGRPVESAEIPPLLGCTPAKALRRRSSAA